MVKSFQDASRRVATKKPTQRRVLNSPGMCFHIGIIKWVSVPAWYEGRSL